MPVVSLLIMGFQDRLMISIVRLTLSKCSKHFERELILIFGDCLFTSKS